MAADQPARWRQAALFALFVFFPVLYLILAGVDLNAIITPYTERCPPQFPKWFGCVVANHESLSGALIGAGGALIAAWLAWHAIMAQIDSDRASGRDANRAYVTGGPGGRMLDKNNNNREIGVVSTGMNTGNTPAFTKKVTWGICKEADWLVVGKEWPDRVKEAKSDVWEEVLPPHMAPSERYIIQCTAEPIPDGENYVCYGTIFYNTVFGDKCTTSWKHRVVREGETLRTYALPGGYSSEWEEDGEGIEFSTPAPRKR